MKYDIVLNLVHIGCRNKCVFCGEGTRMGQKEADILAQRELGKLKSIKDPGQVMSIHVSGGDPIEYHDFLGLLRRIKELTNIKVSLFSHCMAFEDYSFLKEALDIGVISFIQIPVYGHNAEVHDSVTRNPGSFDSAMRAIRNLRRLSFSNLRVQSLLLRQNQEHIRELFAFNSGLAPEMSFMLPCIPSMKREYMKAYADNAPDLGKVSSSLREAGDEFAASGARNMVYFFDIPFCVSGFGPENTGFSNELEKKAPRAYEYLELEKSNVDRKIIGSETIPSYRLLSKTLECRGCIYQDVCHGIQLPYIDLGLFRARPIESEISKYNQQRF